MSFKEYYEGILKIVHINNETWGWFVDIELQELNTFISNNKNNSNNSNSNNSNNKNNSNNSNSNNSNNSNKNNINKFNFIKRKIEIHRNNIQTKLHTILKNTHNPTEHKNIISRPSLSRNLSDLELQFNMDMDMDMESEIEEKRSYTTFYNKLVQGLCFIIVLVVIAS
jgi:hypothetical protein